MEAGSASEHIARSALHRHRFSKLSLFSRQEHPGNKLGLNVVGLYSSLGLSGPFVVDNPASNHQTSVVAKMDHQISKERFSFGRCYMQC